MLIAGLGIGAIALSTQGATDMPPPQPPSEGLAEDLAHTSLANMLKRVDGEGLVAYEGFRVRRTADSCRSCPPLRNEPFVAERLDQQLDDQTRRFLKQTFRIDRDAGKVYLSKILDWYGSDFEESFEPEAGSPYDWSLNEQS